MRLLRHWRRSMRWSKATSAMAEVAIAALDRVRDARGKRLVCSQCGTDWPDGYCEHADDDPVWVRDARGDDEACTCGASFGHVLGCPAGPSARSLQGEDHELGIVSRMAAFGAYEAALNEGATAPVAVGRAADAAIDAYLSRVPSSRDGSVAVEDVLRYFDERGMTLTAGEIRTALRDLGSPASTGDQEKTDG